MDDKIILHVLVVSFHHRNGPQVEFCIPPFPKKEDEKCDLSEAVSLPEEWSFMPFMCLPDGAHSTEEEFIYFHLPPVMDWTGAYQKTLFGLACFRQIDSKDLLNKPADVTRTKVQKSVVVLARHCVLGSVRSKLGLVTQAFFAQRDFSKVEIVENLYDNLNGSIRMPLSDATLFMGLSLREFIYKFKQKALQLFKLLILGKRILFFGHKVERLSAYQYSLVSMLPEILRNLHDVGSVKLENEPVILPMGKVSDLEEKHRSFDNLRAHQIDSHKAKLMKLGHPLRIFGIGSFFQPYIPLQQISVLESADTKSFLAGTSNSIFIHHKSCAIDVVAHADSGTIEIINPAINAVISLSSADKKFMDDLIRPITNSWSPDNDMSQIEQIDFEGSDDDIRARFELYITQMFASVAYDISTPSVLEDGSKKIDYISEFNSTWINAWKCSASYKIWCETRNLDLIGMINPGHPCHGHSVLDSIAASFSAFNRSNTAKQGVSQGIDGESTPNSASQLLQNVSSWYENTKKSVLSRIDNSESISTPLKSGNEDTKLSSIAEVAKEKMEAQLAEALGGSFEHINL